MTVPPAGGHAASRLFRCAEGQYPRRDGRSQQGYNWRWAQYFPHDASNLHRPSDSRQPGLRELNNDRKGLTAAIKPIYTAVRAESAQAELEAFEEGAYVQKSTTVAAAWRRAWEKVTVFFAFPPEVRRVIYTTNAIVSASCARSSRHAGISPATVLAAKLIWLALRNITADSGRSANNWKSAMNQFAIL